MKKTLRSLTAVLMTLCLLMSLIPAALAAVPTATAYIQDADGVDSGEVYVIYHPGSNRILYHENNKSVSDHVTGTVSGDSIALDSSYPTSRQTWTITAVDGGYTIQSQEADGRYLNLNQVTQSGSRVPVTDEAQVLTITEVQGGYTISRTVGDQTLYLAHADVAVGSSPQHYVSDSPCVFQLFKQTEVPAETAEREDLIPQPGTTQDEPFAPGTGGSSNFRIPSIITLDSGRILAAIDARWNHLGDACALDTIVSYSDDGGQTWNYSFANYFEDSVDAKQLNATAFIDPVMVQGKDGTIYLMVDLFPGGVALNTALMAPAKSSGYVEINGVQRLVLYLTPTDTEQNDSNYAYYVGDFVDGYAKIYDLDDAATDYYVDEYYYLYQGDGTDPDAQEIYCQQLGGGSRFIQQNVFFYNADLHVRCATYLWLVTSTDGGETWSAPTILNPQIRTGEDKFYGTGPGAGLCLEDGTIMLPAYTHSDEIASFIYSTDGGETWTRSDDATQTDWSSESCLVQIDGTTVRHFYRDGYSTLRYTDHTWNGEKWVAGDPVDTGVAKTYRNQLSAIQYSQQLDGKEVILVSTATGAGGSRTNGKIYTFVVNEDKTMELVNAYEVTASGAAYGYSSLTEMTDGSIALLYEGAGSRSVFEVIPADELGLPVESTASASVTGDFQVSKGGLAAYTFSLNGDIQADTVELTFTVSDDQNADLFAGRALDGLGGFVYDSQMSKVTTNDDGSVTYHAILYFNLEQEAATAPVDVLSLKVRATDGTGNLTVTLNNAKFALDGVAQTAAIDNASVTTAVKDNIYDVNGDGVVDLGDVSTVRGYYQAKAGDENWAQAQKADLNNDGVVDLEDLILSAKSVLNG